MKYFIKTYGCQMNFADSRHVEELLSRNDLTKSESIEDADFVIVNACSVRKHAEDRALGWIKSVSNRVEKLIVIGCLAVHREEELRKAGADIVKYQFELDDIISNISKDIKAIGKFPSKITAEVPIVRGCDRFCSYCIVPYLRGPVISISPDDILNEINDLVGRGTRIIQLLGQNVCRYQYKGYSFVDLLRDASEIKGIKRLSFLTTHPADLDDSIIDTMAKTDNIMKYIHLPIQSGSDRLLKSMFRGYTTELYRKIIIKIRERIPDVRITTDIMVGLPGEKEGEFLSTLSVVKDIRFDEAYMFAFSPREGSLDNLKKDILFEVERKRRLKILIEEQRNITMEKKREKIGKTMEVIVIKRAKSEELFFTIGENGSPVLIEKQAKPGDILSVRISGLKGGSLFGEVISG